MARGRYRCPPSPLARARLLPERFPRATLSQCPAIVRPSLRSDLQCLPRMPENGCADSEAVYGCSTFSTRRELRNTQGLPIHDCVNSLRGSLFYISIDKCDYTFVGPIHTIGHHACARLALSVTASLSLSIAAMALDSQTAMIGGIAPRARTQESPARAHSPWGKGRSPCAWVAHIATLRIEALRPRATAQPGARKRTRDSTHYPGTHKFNSGQGHMQMWSNLGEPEAWNVKGFELLLPFGWNTHIPPKPATA